MVRPAVVLTRQRHRLGNMAEVLEAIGFRAMAFETLTTEPVYSDLLDAQFRRLDEFTDLVFVSRNAVDYTMQLLEHLGLQFPQNNRVLAVGAETAKQLRTYKIDALFPEKGVGVAALLAVSQLAELSARKVLIIRGTKGLSWPLEEFRKRGATVEHADIYTQIRPEESEELVTNFLAEGHAVRAALLHSGESAAYFMQIVESQMDKLEQTLLVVGSKRISNVLRELGWKGDIIVAESPKNKHMMQAFNAELASVAA